MAGHQTRGNGVKFDASAQGCWTILLRQALTDCVDGDEWFDQRQSPLVAHCATVRARLDAGKSGARVEGDRYLLSTAAIAEELANGST